VELKIGIVKLKNLMNVMPPLINVGLSHGIHHFQKNVMLLMLFVLKFGVKKKIKKYSINKK